MLAHAWQVTFVSRPSSSLILLVHDLVHITQGLFIDDIMRFLRNLSPQTSGVARGAGGNRPGREPGGWQMGYKKKHEI